MYIYKYREKVWIVKKCLRGEGWGEYHENYFSKTNQTHFPILYSNLVSSNSMHTNTFHNIYTVRCFFACIWHKMIKTNCIDSIYKFEGKQRQWTAIKNIDINKLMKWNRNENVFHCQNRIDDSLH